MRILGNSQSGKGDKKKSESAIPAPANYGSGVVKSIDLSRQMRFYVRISNAKKYRTLIKICEANQNIFAG